MELELNDRSILLHCLLDFGEKMLTAGAEIHRVEDTMLRLGQAYGVGNISIFVITSSIWVSISFPDGQELTMTRSISPGTRTDFIKMEQLNALSRRCCRSLLPMEELRRELQCLDQPIPPWWLYLGSFLGAGAFSMFFGGHLLDGLTAAVFGLLICLFLRKLSSFCPNTVVFNIFCSFSVGLLLCIVGRIFPVLHVDTIMIGDMMLLIPGLPMTNSMRDLLVGDTISGVMRLIESLLWAVALAVGFMVAIWLIGG